MQNIKINIMRPKGFHKNIELIVSKAIKNVNINNGWKNISSCPVCKKKKKFFG